MLNKSEHIGKILREDVYADQEASEDENIGSVLVSAHCEMTNEVIEDRFKSLVEIAEKPIKLKL